MVRAEVFRGRFRDWWFSEKYAEVRRKAKAFDPADNLAEIAFLVRDDWQQRGIGTFLFRKMTDIALKRGIGGFKAEVLAQNRKMMYVFQKSRFPVKTKLEDGAYYLEILFKGGEQG